MKLSSTIDHTLSPTLRAASVRLSRQVSAAPERIFDAWLNADEARTLLFAGPIGAAIRTFPTEAESITAWGLAWGESR